MKKLLVYLPLMAALSASAGEQLLNLPKAPKEGRFKTPTELTWPANPGDAEVCLWKDDKFAACSITIDDNCKPDHEWWLRLTDELGIKVTWFVITDGVKNQKNPGFSGTWSDWQRLADAGHSLQSHTTNHRSAKKGEPPIPEADLAAMYRDSLAELNANITNNFACCIAYPCGEAHEEILSRYAIAARGVYGVPSAANTINYLNTNKGGGGTAYTDMILEGTTDKDPKWLRGKKELKRGWNTLLYHLVHHGSNAEQKEKNAAAAEAEIRAIAVHKDRLWIARFDDVVKYGQERDSATLKSKLEGDTIILSLTDRMKDEIFDYPLTVKVRLPDDWKTVKGGKLVRHEGRNYALVEVVPDRKPVVIKK